MNRRQALRMGSVFTGSFLLSPFTGEVAAAGFARELEDTSPLLRLGSNENPYGPSRMSARRMREAVSVANRYPSQNIRLLLEKIAARHGVSPDNVLLGAGSSELLGLASLLYLQHGGELATCDPTFRIWTSMATELGAVLKTVPLTGDKKFDLRALDQATGSATRMVYVCNPNNPTGTRLERSDLAAFLTAQTALRPVVLDEVYHDFIAETSFAAEAAQNPNLLVVRSFSKVFGLAGMRVGYVVAHADTIQKLEKRQPWANNSVSQVAAAAAIGALEDSAFLAHSLDKNKEALQVTTDYLTLKKVRWIPSHANLLYFSLDQFPADFLKLMEARQVIVREIKEPDGRWCRVSMGTPDDMRLFCKRLGQLEG